jgi:pimeloyl-ACP methyl ester carboxylesterase
MYLESNKREAPWSTDHRPPIGYPWPLTVSWRFSRVAKHPKLSPVPEATVRTRRAYFDCRFGQLHVRTAFPTTGGFDEGVTLVCLHSREGSSRSFARFLPEIATDRSVYAPDLPGFGESDASPTLSHPVPGPGHPGPGYPAAGHSNAAPAPAPAGVGQAEAARAVGELAMDLRLRQIDLLGVRFGAAVALDLASARPELVRRLVLVGAPPMDHIPPIKQQSLIVKVGSEGTDEIKWSRGTLQNARVLELTHQADDPFDADPKDLARQIGGFLRG